MSPGEDKKCTVTEYRTPPKNDTDLIFSANQTNSEVPNLRSIYNDFCIYFGKTLDRLGKGSKEYRGSNGKHRQITLHSFRRAVKSMISDLGYQDYSEWFIGHSGSTYYRKFTFRYSNEWNVPSILSLQILGRSAYVTRT